MVNIDHYNVQWNKDNIKIYAYYHHFNSDFSEASLAIGYKVVKKLPKPIEAVMNTPSHHRVHHGSNPQYIDKNYAGIFIIWDKLFGTFAAEEEPVNYGVTTPINTVNPLKVFFLGLTKISTQMSNTKGFINKIKCLVKPPGWVPDAL